MANKRISDLDTVVTVDGTEAIPIAKNGLNYKLTVTMIKNWIGLASTTIAGLMSKEQATKLAGMDTGATKNSTDAELRARSSHTGTQAASTIEGLKAVATSGNYADLTNKPYLSLSWLGAAPASHVGSGGPEAHAMATESEAGFMGPVHVMAMNELKNLAFSADYADILNAPFLQKGAHMGFSWFPDYAQPKGSTFNDYNSFGSGVYTPMAATGATYDAASEYHTFSSLAATYEIAGIRSAGAVAKRGNNGLQGGFVFEGVVGFKYRAGSNAFFGVDATPDPGYRNWNDGAEGILIGYTAAEAGTARLQLMVGNGVTSQKIQTEVAEALTTDQTCFVRISVAPGATSGFVTVKSLNTGALLFDNVEITDMLPRADKPLYCIAQAGTLATTIATTLRLFGMSLRRWQPF